MTCGIICCVLNMFMFSLKQLYMYLKLCLHVFIPRRRKDSDGLVKHASLEHWHVTNCGGEGKLELHIPGDFPRRLLPGV